MGSSFSKGEKVIEGKTKVIWETKENSRLVIVENKNDITKNDDASATMEMDSKAKYATATTCAIFELLKESGIPVAYEAQISETEFLAKNCEMILLEVIGRRYAVGSFLKRFPNLKMPDGEPPKRFHNWKFELFLKTNNGKIVDKNGGHQGDTPFDVLYPEKKKPVDDPFILEPYNEAWALCHPKVPRWNEDFYLKELVDANNILPELEHCGVKDIEEILRKVVLVLEGAFAQFGVRFIDIKIEFGITADDELVVSDVIDNDSWRLRDSDWNELSKQLFRDNADMSLIQDKYSLVANLVQKFRIPKQAIVLWRGSSSDNFPKIPEIAGVKVVEVTLSGHKSPKKCMNRLEEILARFPEGGVILSVIGMSNGLGPTLSARTSWPVISVPATAKSRPHDVWSSLESPSKVPLLTVLSPENAVLAALDILAQKNPVAYMTRQLEIEKLDD